MFAMKMKYVCSALFKKNMSVQINRYENQSDFKRCLLNHFKYSFPSVFMIL